MEAHTYNPNSQEAKKKKKKAEGSLLQDQDQPHLYSQFWESHGYIVRARIGLKKESEITFKPFINGTVIRGFSSRQQTYLNGLWPTQYFYESSISENNLFYNNS